MVTKSLEPHDQHPSYREAVSRILQAAQMGFKTLMLQGFDLHALPPEIGQCKGLTALDLSDNHLTTLPPEIGQCTKLSILDLNDNHLRELPREIGRCGALTKLFLANNQLKTLPLELRECEALKILYLHENPELGLPPEVLGAGQFDAPEARSRRADSRALLHYYFFREKPLNEVKIIFVGWGNSGKTSLVKRLVKNRFARGQAETLGVQLSRWQMRDRFGGPVTAHLWDFAGQTITHAMHQFFLSVRSVYVLLLTGRGSSEADDAEYWLKLISAFGTDHAGLGPPVFVVLNKWDDPGSRAHLDRRAIKERHPFIVDFVETDCKTATGISELRRLLEDHVETLPWVREVYPHSYWTVKERLQKAKEPHLSYEQFRGICAECGIQEEKWQDALAVHFHELGIALNFGHDARLRFACVLKPDWLTTHGYALVRHAERQAGVLRRSELPAVLAGEPDPGMRQFLVDTMVRFELAYPVTEDGEEPEMWLLPQALPDSQPKGVESFSTATAATHLRYTYRALPKSIVPRFIVRTHPLIENDLRWASGVVLTLKGARALIRANYADKRISVIVTGGQAKDRRGLAGLAQRELRFINSQIKGLNPEEETQAAGEWIPVETLERDEAAGRNTGVPTKAGTVNVDPAGELNEFSAPAARDRSWKPRVFISYSHTDEVHRKKLELYLTVLATYGIVFETWHDRKILPGEEWDGRIREELAEADVILFLTSTAALASKYIESVEMKVALKSKTKVVIPILLEECHWQLTPLRKLQVLPKSKPVREWKHVFKGWMNVSDGLKTVLTALHQRGPKVPRKSKPGKSKGGPSR